MAEQLAFPLPYEAIEVIPNREAARATLKDVGGKLGRQTMIVPIAQIIVRENFNWRLKPEGISIDQWLYDPNYLDIASLAEGIYQSNGNPPLEADMTADGFFVITEGFRRFMARYRLIKDGRLQFPDGSEVSMVEVLVNPKETTELDRMRRIFTSQDNKKLAAIELGHGFLRIKTTHNLTNEAIAASIGKSRQYVDDKIALAQQPQIIQDAINSGQLSATAAVALNHNVKSETERVHLVEESINNGTPISVAQASKQEQKEKAENKQQDIFSEAGSKADRKDQEQNASIGKAEAMKAANNAIKNADRIRKYTKGLNEQNQKDVEDMLDWIVNDATTARAYIKSVKEH